MSAVKAPSAALEIAALIDRLRLTVAASSLVDQTLLEHPDLLDRWTGVSEDAPPSSTLQLPRTNGSDHEVDTQEVVRYLQEHGHHTEFTRAQFTSAIMLVGDALRRNSYFNQQRPEFDFFRLLRKAVNHGNRWRFQGNALPRKAEFNGIVLSKGLADKPVLFETFGQGDVFDLFDAIAARLRKIG